MDLRIPTVENDGSKREKGHFPSDCFDAIRRNFP